MWFKNKSFIISHSLQVISIYSFIQRQQIMNTLYNIWFYELDCNLNLSLRFLFLQSELCKYILLSNLSRIDLSRIIAAFDRQDWKLNAHKINEPVRSLSLISPSLFPILLYAISSLLYESDSSFVHSILCPESYSWTSLYRAIRNLVDKR